MTILTIDIGNTNTLFGLYENDTLVEHWRIKTDRDRMPDEYGIVILGLFGHANYQSTQVEGICMSSVVPPLTKIMTRMCERYFNQFPLLIEPGTNVGIAIEVDNPESVGADRIVDAVATHKLYGGPACIVDLGTATTFDVISETGNYLGGVISPGISISADALFLRTAKLPRVELAPPPNVIGKNTVHAIQSGLLYGYVGLIEGVVKRIKAEIGPTTQVIATGGLARTISEETDIIDHINPWLTLEGLRLIWKMHHPDV